MPFCDEYEKLDNQEKAIFIGELAHCSMFDKESFERAAWIINDARKRGILDRVKFGGNEIYNTGKPLSETDKNAY